MIHRETAGIGGWAESRSTRSAAWTAIGVITTIVLSGCASPGEEPTPLPPAPSSSTVDPDEPTEDQVQPVGEPETVASGLSSPWSLAVLDSGAALVSERDSGRVKEVSPNGAIREVATVPGVVSGGEGGLLGLAVLVDGEETWLYAYLTAASDNRIVRMPLTGEIGNYALGAPELLLSGLQKAATHNGGRIKFGPDGMLYATVGDAGKRSVAQDPGSLNGKILRMTPTGDVPEDNPIDDSLVYSLGHRNPQGIAWDTDGQLWASEFGQDSWDEFNRILPGSNYGWPVVEGANDNGDFVNPEFQWATTDASPSGLAYMQNTFFLAALRGERVWALYDNKAVDAVPYFQEQYGRIRDVAEGPDGTLWLLTNNTDGRGDPAEDDDRIISVQLASLTDD